MKQRFVVEVEVYANSMISNQARSAEFFQHKCDPSKLGTASNICNFEDDLRRRQSLFCAPIPPDFFVDSHTNTAIMSDAGDVEVEVPQSGNQILPKDVTAEIGSIKLFNKWSYEDVEIRDISLT